MSLENEIKNLTAAVQALTAAMTQTANAAEMISVATAAAPAPVAAPVAAVVEAPANVIQMPSLPSFQQPVAAPAPTGAPFTDAPGLMQYAMAKYQSLGEAKGAQIQNVLLSMGIQNMNDIKPEQYAAFYAGCEAIQ